VAAEEGLVWTPKVQSFSVPYSNLVSGDEESYKVMFEGRNSYQLPLAIKEAVVDCPCVGLEWPQGELPPGGLVELAVLVRGSALYKPGKYSVLIKDSLGGSSLLQLSVEARPPYKYPLELVWSPLDRRKEFVLEKNPDFSGIGLNVVEVKAVSRDYKVVWKEDGGEKTGVYRVIVETAGDGPPGKGGVLVRLSGGLSFFIKFVSAS
jgi:hypothetical protein